MLPVQCFAPPLTDELLSSYKMTIERCESQQTKDYCTTLLNIIRLWWELPESKRKDGQCVDIMHCGAAHSIHFAPLEVDHQNKLEKHIPWRTELDSMKDYFLTLDGKIRDIAFHLLWHVVELEAGREPFTNDKLPG